MKRRGRCEGRIGSFIDSFEPLRFRATKVQIFPDQIDISPRCSPPRSFRLSTTRQLPLSRGKKNPFHPFPTIRVTSRGNSSSSIREQKHESPSFLSFVHRTTSFRKRSSFYGKFVQIFLPNERQKFLFRVGDRKGIKLVIEDDRRRKLFLSYIAKKYQKSLFSSEPPLLKGAQSIVRSSFSRN